MKNASLMALALTLTCGFVFAAEEKMDAKKDDKAAEKPKSSVLKAAGLGSSPAKPANAPAGKTAGPSSGGTGLVTVEFPVSGMMCNNCVASVESTFKGADGVTAAKPDMAKNMTTVTYDRSKTDLDTILATFMAKKARRFDAAKPGEQIKSQIFSYDGKEESVKGALAVKGKDAAGDVICRIVARRNGEQNERAINVIASGELAQKIELARSKGEEPTLVGVMSEKGLTVSKIQ